MRLSTGFGFLGFVIVIATCVCFVTNRANASDDPTRYATAQDIEGNWQLLPLPDTVQPKLLSANPWPAQCQWYSYSSTGQLKSHDRYLAPNKLSESCEEMSSKQLNEHLTHVPAVQSWRYDFSPARQQGLIIVTRKDVKAGYMEPWAPRIVTKAHSKGGVDFSEGDMVLYFMKLSTNQVQWIRHLRRLK